MKVYDILTWAYAAGMVAGVLLIMFVLIGAILLLTAFILGVTP